MWFGNRVIADAIGSNGAMPVYGGPLIQHDYVLIRRDTATQGKTSDNGARETGVLYLQAKDSLA